MQEIIVIPFDNKSMKRMLMKKYGKCNNVKMQVYPTYIYLEILH